MAPGQTLGFINSSAELATNCFLITDPVEWEENDKKIEEIKRASFKMWQNVIDSILSGTISGVYYDTGNGKRFGRKVLTVSTREPGMLQLTYFIISGNEYIPLSHDTTKDVEELYLGAPDFVCLTCF